MKRNFLWPGFLLGLILIACNAITGKKSVDGIYVNHSEGQYSVADDTLVAEQADGNMVLIHRKTGFRRLADGKPGKREYEREEWKAVWDEKKQVLQELRKGRLLYLEQDAKQLILGKRVYKKVK